MALDYSRSALRYAVPGISDDMVTVALAHGNGARNYDEAIARCKAVAEDTRKQGYDILARTMDSAATVWECARITRVTGKRQ